MLPLLTIYSDAISMFGSFVGVNIKGDVNFRLFFSQAFAQLSFTDLIPALIKTTLFGLVIGLISCYKGYYSDKGTEGVGQAANASVVISSLLIFIIDILAVQVSNFIIE
jgi:phospholipid/cholesterol/gamma-HCH transport system permease protein